MKIIEISWFHIFKISSDKSKKTDNLYKYYKYARYTWWNFLCTCSKICMNFNCYKLRSTLLAWLKLPQQRRHITSRWCSVYRPTKDNISLHSACVSYYILLVSLQVWIIKTRIWHSSLSPPLSITVDYLKQSDYGIRCRSLDFMEDAMMRCKIRFI